MITSNNSVKNVIAISDIHGNMAVFTELDKLIKKYPLAQIVFLGDYIDGHKQGFQVLNKIRDYQSKLPTQVLVLKGNHEQMFLDYMDTEDQLWFVNGGQATLKEWAYQLTGRGYSIDKDRKLVKRDNPEILDWINNMPLTYSIGHLFFVHAGLDWNKSDPRTQTQPDEMLWIRDAYIYQMSSSDPVFEHNPLNQALITGHTPTLLIYGEYDDNRPGFKNVFTNQSDPCPIKQVQYPGEYARFFIDGGNHGGLARIGNIAVFNSETGQLIDSYQD